MEHQDVFKTNKQTWENRTMIHYNSDFYDKHAFAKARNSLNLYEQQALGNVTGKSLLHLQCHFGQDSLSWAQKGAQVTGVDISHSAIALARKLSEELEIPANFVCCNVLDVSNHIKERFDVVFTSYGVISWLPDLTPWAHMIKERLKPGGTFYMVEFHPIVWMFDYLKTPPVMAYHYAQKKAIYEEYMGTYAAPDTQIESKETTWNHSLSEVINALIQAGLQIKWLREHDGSPYKIFPDMVVSDDLFYLKNQLYPTIFEIEAQG